MEAPGGTTNGGWGNLTRTHMKMAMLKARFEKQMELDSAESEEATTTRRLDPTASVSASAAATIGAGEGDEASLSRGRGLQRWSRIRQAVVSANMFRHTRGGEQEQETKYESVEEEDEGLTKYWKSVHLPPPAPPPTFQQQDAADLPDFDREFAADAEQVSVTMSKVPESVLQHEKERLEARLFEQRELALDAIKNRESDLVWREMLARQRVESLEEAARQNISTERQKTEAQFLEREKQLGRDYRRTRERLEMEVKQRNCALMEEFGRLEIGTESISRLMHLRSGSLPQPVEVRVHQLRAVKEKLPKGAYVLMLSQYESVGGQPLRWSELTENGIGPSFPAVTAAVQHQGRFFDKMLRFEDSLFALCPPQNRLKPGFTFVLELFQVSTRTNALDKCVAWSVLPMCTEHFTIPQGKYKIPFLKGAHSPLVQNYKDVERAMATDINSWLCNGYIEVRVFPLKELLSTLESSASDLLSTKNLRIQYDFLNKKIQARATAGGTDVGDVSAPWKVDSLHLRRRHKPGTTSLSSFAARGSKGQLVLESIVGGQSFKNHEPSAASWASSFMAYFQQRDRQQRIYASASADEESVHVFSADLDVASAKLRDDGKDLDFETKKAALTLDRTDELRVFERGYREEDELFLHPEQSGKLAGVETVDDGDDRRWATSGLEGDIVRRWQSDGLRLDSEVAADTEELSRATGVEISARCDWKMLDNARDMELYTYSIASNPSQRKRLLPGAIAAFKLRFLSLEALGDLMPHLWGSLDCNITFFVLIIALWLRIYLHYVGEYIFLAGAGAPIFSFKLQGLQISFKYMSPSISQAAEIGLVAIGPICNNIFFLAFSLAGSLTYALAGFVPEGYNKFVSCFGIATLLDPLLILLVDLGYQNYNCAARSTSCSVDYTSVNCHCFVGDFAKLWERTLRDEGNGISGLLITLLIYAGNSIISSFVLVEYLVHVHRNARILDIWRRISGPSEEFFVPEDFEVSHEELSSICKRAESWRGPAGSRRRIVVRNYTETDKIDSKFQKATAHVAIYELGGVEGAGGTRVPLKLYRQFLRHDDTTIVETFGPLNLSSAEGLFLAGGSGQAQVGGGEGGEGGGRGAKGEVVDEEEALILTKPEPKRLFQGLERF